MICVPKMSIFKLRNHNECNKSNWCQEWKERINKETSSIEHNEPLAQCELEDKIKL
jgi:hypothetical protein